ncbi:MAG: energy transducer TonB family protein [Caulobacteraceae bacterium]
MLVSLLAAAAVAASPQLITHPDWRKRPTGNDLARVYPAYAAQHHISGRAEMNCIVDVHGLLESCQVTSESPSGEGFGAAALLLAPTFSMNPAFGPNGPVPARINIPITFLMSGSAPTSTPSESPYGGGSRLSPLKSDASYANYGKTLIVHPVWATAPSFADVGAAYPAEAAGAAGHVVLQCRVVRDGALKICSTFAEEPRGKGFARAAQTLVPRFRMSAESLPAKDSGPAYVDVPFLLIDPSSVEFKQRRIGAPTWRLALDPTKVAQVFPAAAAAKGITTGRGVAKCSVAADGALTDCQEMPGDPDGMGFSHSAVVIASAMAMNPWTDEGGPVDGATIALPIRFNLAAGAPAAAASPSK